MPALTLDERRTAALLLATGHGPVSPTLLEHPSVRAAVAAPARLSPRRRRLERFAMRAGLLTYERNCLGPLARAVQAASPDGGRGAPRVLVRVDEFPHYRAWDEPSRYGTEQFRRFHEIMSSHGVRYLVAVTPRVARSPLDPQETAERDWDDGERRMLEELGEASVSFAVHGWCHRTRVESPRRRSELAGLGPEELDRLLDSADAELRRLGVEPAVFVPTFNLFDARQLPSLARRYEVVCGGPETVSALGFRRPPAWLDGCVYLPSYPPLYGRAQEVLPALRPLVEADVRLWVPVTLHWGWEADEDWSSLSALARELAPVAAGWEQFLAAVRTSAAAADNVGS